MSRGSSCREPAIHVADRPAGAGASGNSQIADRGLRTQARPGLDGGMTSCESHRQTSALLCGGWGLHLAPLFTARRALLFFLFFRGPPPGGKILGVKKFPPP